MNRLFLAYIASGLALASLGCNQPAAVDPALVEQYRAKLVMPDEPEGARTVVEVRNAMYGVEDAAEGHDHEHEGEAATAEATADASQAANEHADHEHAEGEEGHEHDHEHAEGEAAHEHEHEHVHGAATAGKEPVIDEMEVVLVGAVGGVPNPSEQSHPEFPFAKNQAVFFLADPEAVAEIEEHAHQHAPGEECSFCASHAADAASLIAVVQFAENGKPIPVDARQLFDLKEKETVVVKGTAKIAGGILTVDADGLYVRR
ncbi:MAG: hypothetical protein DCC67_10270 [Planctomycetota bacterium]|nr:MAG: hypothetical protein DCC67_10270 [Planctomycetota bacterium]